MSFVTCYIGKKNENIIFFKEAYQAFLVMKIVLGIYQVLNKHFEVREQRIIIRALWTFQNYWAVVMKLQIVIFSKSWYSLNANNQCLKKEDNKDIQIH